jgi:Protein of unknown function (DUF1440)
MAVRVHTRNQLGRDLLKGAIAGAVATFVMSKVTSYMYEHEDRDARRREDDVRGGQQDGSAMHWTLGIGAGAAYAVARRRLRFFGNTGGAAFGTAFWAVLDEGIVPLLGLTPGPAGFPWQAHARGLVGHLTFGTVTDGTLRLLDRVS